MAATNPVTEAELETAFREDTDYAIELLDLDYREQIIQYIKRETWGILKEDELMVVYQETMLALIQKVRQEGFDPSRPLRMVNTIARNKGIDALRARRRCRMNTNEDAILGGVAASLKDTELGFQWRLLGPAEWREFREVLLEVMQVLPERQKLVARCFVDCFEDVIREGSYRPLALAVGAITGNPETVVNVKSTWHAAKKKLATMLTQRGFNFIPAE
jgi:DNA-directed RNA polymerase specialized sigma24 family protein